MSSNSIANTSNNATSSFSSGGCPVKHEQLKYNSTLSDTSNNTITNNNISSVLSGGCPHQHGMKIKDDTILRTIDNIPVPNECPQHWNTIPSSGRGNSDDGLAWENPSPRQLYTALKRKNKAGDLEENGLIDSTIVKSVADAHAVVTKLAWDGVMRYEKLHAHHCSKPVLLKFNGNTELTLKARFWQLLGHEVPFDRHDWYVDRCGREIKYIIDFYSVPGNESKMVVDCRPSLSASGVIDIIHANTKEGFVNYAKSFFKK